MRSLAMCARSWAGGSWLWVSHSPRCFSIFLIAIRRIRSLVFDGRRGKNAVVCKNSSEDIHDHSDRSGPLQIRNANRRTPDSGKSHPSHTAARNRNGMRIDRPRAFPILRNYLARNENTRWSVDCGADRYLHQQLALAAAAVKVAGGDARTGVEQGEFAVHLLHPGFQLDVGEWALDVDLQPTDGVDDLDKTVCVPQGHGRPASIEGEFSNFYF